MRRLPHIVAAGVVVVVLSQACGGGGEQPIIETEPVTGAKVAREG